MTVRSSDFNNPAVRKSIEMYLQIINALNQMLKMLEWYIEKDRSPARLSHLVSAAPDPRRRRQILALATLHEIHDVRCSPS